MWFHGTASIYNLYVFIKVHIFYYILCYKAIISFIGLAWIYRQLTIIGVKIGVII